MESKPKEAVAEKVIGFKGEWQTYEMTPSRAILYSLGLGFSSDPTNKDHLNFTYENGDSFSAFPTMSSVIPLQALLDFFPDIPGLPEINPMMILHGEEYLEAFNPLPTEGSIKFQPEIVDLEERKSGTVLLTKVVLRNEKDELLANVYANTFIRGTKAFGYKSTGPLQSFTIPKVPTSTPKETYKIQTRADQAVLYRLGGNDLNPLHIDPEMASMGGFEKPILHGLCSYGMGARAAYELFFQGNPEALKSYNARFTSHVFPGETLIFNFWKESNGKLIIVGVTEERKLAVLVGEIQLQQAKF